MLINPCRRRMSPVHPATSTKNSHACLPSRRKQITDQREPEPRGHSVALLLPTRGEIRVIRVRGQSCYPRRRDASHVADSLRLTRVSRAASASRRHRRCRVRVGRVSSQFVAKWVSGPDPASCFDSADGDEDATARLCMPVGRRSQHTPTSPPAPLAHNLRSGRQDAGHKRTNEWTGKPPLLWAGQPRFARQSAGCTVYVPGRPCASASARAADSGRICTRRNAATDAEPQRTE